MSKTYRNKLSAEGVREVQERRRSSATRFTDRKPRRTERRQAIRESRES